MTSLEPSRQLPHDNTTVRLYCAWSQKKMEGKKYAAGGVCMWKPDATVPLCEMTFPLGSLPSREAAYKTVLTGLVQAIAMGAEHIFIYTSESYLSEWLSIPGGMQGDSPAAVRDHNELLVKLSSLKFWDIEHVSTVANDRAIQLAIKAIKSPQTPRVITIPPGTRVELGGEHIGTVVDKPRPMPASQIPMGVPGRTMKVNGTRVDKCEPPIPVILTRTLHFAFLEDILELFSTRTSATPDSVLPDSSFAIPFLRTGTMAEMVSVTYHPNGRVIAGCMQVIGSHVGPPDDPLNGNSIYGLGFMCDIQAVKVIEPPAGNVPPDNFRPLPPDPPPTKMGGPGPRDLVLH